MVLQALTSVVYDVTAGSWIVVSIISKYYLVGAAVYLYSSGGLTWESFSDRVLEDSRKVLSAAVALGAVLSFSGLQVEALLLPVSELIGLAYLGFLFWKF
jgi:hypothetical protein